MAVEENQPADVGPLCYAQNGSRRRLPFVLLIVGVYLMVGCIPIPATRLFQPNGNRTPDAKVGTRTSSPVSINHTRIEDALIVLVNQVVPNDSYGSHYLPPWAAQRIDTWTMSEDGRRFWVMYQVKTATVVWPLCFAANVESQSRTLELNVNEEGIVTKAEVLTLAAPWLKSGGPNYVGFNEVHRYFSPDQLAKLRDAGLVLTEVQRLAYETQQEQFQSQWRERNRRAAERRRMTTLPATQPKNTAP